MPMPRRTRPRMSIRTFMAAPLMAEPSRKVIPPANMDHFLPNILVTVDARKDERRAAQYREDVKRVSNWLSNLQYWLVLESAICCL